MTIHDPVTSSTAALIIRCGESSVRYYADRGRIRYQRLPSGIRLYERADCERVRCERQERRQKAVEGNAPAAGMATGT